MANKNKSLLLLKNKFYFLFKKKTMKKKDILRNANLYLIFKYFKIFVFFNVYVDNFYKNKFLIKYNLAKNLFFFFFFLCNWIYKNIRIKLKILYKRFLIKNLLIKNPNIISDCSFINKYFLFFKNCKLKILFSRKNKFINLKIRKNIRTKLYIKKKTKKNIKKNIPIKLSTILFFNKKKRKFFFSSIKLLMKIYRINIGPEKKKFIKYWKCYYIYILKQIYVYIEYLIRKLFNYILQKYKLFFTFITWKLEKINKRLFFFLFLFDKKRNNFLKNYKVYNIYNISSKLINLNLWEKKKFNLFFFNIIKKFNLSLYKLKLNLNLLKTFLLIKFLINLKTFLVLFFLQLLIYWFDYFIIIKNNRVLISVDSINYNLLFFKIKNFITIIRKVRWQRFSFIKMNFILYNNIKQWLI